jgi:hypothetical protein
MLPTGMTLETATAGFRNQGQFVAALNASRNQGVSFVDLQKAITVDGLSLGQAVKKVKSMPPAPEAGTGSSAGSGTTSTGSSTAGTTSTSSTSTTTASSSKSKAKPRPGASQW